jgi:hypothetical protein
MAIDGEHALRVVEFFADILVQSVSRSLLVAGDLLAIVSTVLPRVST